MSVVGALREQGFVVTTALAEHMLRVGDEQQLAFAGERDFLLVTHNQRHFWRWHSTFLEQGRPHGGLVLVPGTPPLERLILRIRMMLDWIATVPDHRSQLFQWGHLQDLLDRGLRLPGYTDDELRWVRGRSRRS